MDVSRWVGGTGVIVIPAARGPPLRMRAIHLEPRSVRVVLTTDSFAPPSAGAEANDSGAGYSAAAAARRPTPQLTSRERVAAVVRRVIEHSALKFSAIRFRKNHPKAAPIVSVHDDGTRAAEQLLADTSLALELRDGDWVRAPSAPGGSGVTYVLRLNAPARAETDTRLAVLAATAVSSRPGSRVDLCCTGKQVDGLWFEFRSVGTGGEAPAGTA